MDYRGQRLTATHHLTATLLASTALVGAVPALAGELPTGGTVAYGAVGITTPQPNAMAITQSSGTAIVNWQGFSIGSGARVDISQPSSLSSLLNRVIGSTPSTIAGQLNANGQVYLVNPNGIAITKTGVVKAGAFVASTLGISDEDFINGKRIFTGNGRSAAVTNEGAIEIGRGGYAALIGGTVDNAGTVSVPIGKVGLGAGEQATLDLSGDGFLQVAVPSTQTGSGDLIRQSGRIRANGGRVEIKAATAREMARQVINMSGVIEARTVSGRSGAIVLGGGEGGKITISGQLDARGLHRDAKGGAVTVTGRHIDLKGASIDASGTAGGGSIRIGGAYQGKGDLPRAQTTAVDKNTTIKADATTKGNGGNIVIWSDEKTTYAGMISAKGGPEGGNGGNAEVSGKAVLEYQGLVNLSAPKGSFGTLLLDPTNVSIDATGATVVPGNNSPNPSVSSISVVSLQDTLNSASVTINTFATGTDLGDISVNVPITWLSGTTLTLQADNNIIINQDITATAGGLSLQAGGLITTPTAPLGAIKVGTFILQGGNWEQNTANLPAFTASDFRIETSESGNAAGSFLRVLGGDGSVGAPYQITDVYGLQGIATRGDYLAASYVLTNDIDATGTGNWNPVPEQPGAFSGFLPIGGNIVGDQAPFSGNFNGAGHVISGLTIGRPGDLNVGLFGQTESSETGSNNIQAVTLSGVSIVGGATTGALIGTNNGSIITNVHASGSVTGTVDQRGTSSSAQVTVGGLVGNNAGTISRSGYGALSGIGTSGDTVRGVAFADEGSASVTVGGLVGINLGAINQTFTRATISSSANSTGGPAVTIIQGGLAGSNEAGTVQQSYSQSDIPAGILNGAPVLTRGGLVGANSGIIEEAYASGAVPFDTVGSGNPTQIVGGLVGTNENLSSSVTRSFWDTTATGRSAGFGTNQGTFEATSLTTEQLTTATTFVPLARAQGWNFETTWAPPDGLYYPELYAVSPVIRVIPGDVSRQYGQPNPALPVIASFGGPSSFVFGPPGDVVNPSGALATSATTNSAVGIYPITAPIDPTTGAPLIISALGVPYRVVVTGPDGASAASPTLTVTPAPLTIVANNQIKPFGTNLVFTGSEFTPVGLVNGDQISSVAFSSPGSGSAAFFGLYPIFVGDAQGDIANYNVTYVPGTLIVGPNPAIAAEAGRGTNLVSNLPTTIPITWNPPDTIVIEDSGGGSGGSGGGGGGGPTLGTGLGTITRDAALATLAFVEQVSAELQQRIAECENRLDRREIDAKGYSSCVGDALERYARDLDSRVVELPPPFRGIAATIRQTAQRVRVARTVQEARAAVRVAISVVRKAIALLRADDEPAIARIQIQQGASPTRARAEAKEVARIRARQGAAIASSLEMVEARLTKAVGL
ncbi:filamentous hemagglutinin N-terminal domain-containing protein [Microvirga massiliensis]|uniref:two-partner secretion domain-containing protein n=1 Tax=Microvirga massiliensis TaxID=1033741 RepID=UPI000660FB80|nr:filamentous hemagglutinin N-terminal domain-containing protein [Microvirga massiliensis]